MGQHWCFAHNGQLADFEPPKGIYRPVGDTDSERAFCDLLNRIRLDFPDRCPPDNLLPVLLGACVEYRRKGVFNCLLSNGEWLFSFCSTKLAEITRRAPFGPAQLRDAELTVNFHAETTPDDVVTVRHRAADEQRTMDAARARPVESMAPRRVYRPGRVAEC